MRRNLKNNEFAATIRLYFVTFSAAVGCFGGLKLMSVTTKTEMKDKASYTRTGAIGTVSPVSAGIRA
jgi:hypothetical protein